MQKTQKLLDSIALQNHWLNRLKKSDIIANVENFKFYKKLQQKQETFQRHQVADNIL